MDGEAREQTTHRATNVTYGSQRGLLVIFYDGATKIAWTRRIVGNLITSTATISITDAQTSNKNGQAFLRHVIEDTANVKSTKAIKATHTTFL